jgi:hypothetical protein
MEEAPGQDYTIVVRFLHHLQMGVATWTFEQQQRMTNQRSKPSGLWETSQRAEEERIDDELMDEEHGQIAEQEHEEV